ncbi:MAG: type II toxin-antitoxin system VapC family toxin [Allosphingosinicella sp.]
MHVVDTSILISWVVPEAASQATLRYAGTGLTAPDLLLVEFANALWKKVRKSEIDTLQARVALATVPVPIALVPAALLAGEALEIGLELEHPVYDCLFLALARRTEAKLLTIDRRLARRCAGTRYEPLVKLVGEKEG